MHAQREHANSKVLNLHFVYGNFQYVVQSGVGASEGHHQAETTDPLLRLKKFNLSDQINNLMHS